MSASVRNTCLLLVVCGSVACLPAWPVWDAREPPTSAAPFPVAHFSTSTWRGDLEGGWAGDRVRGLASLGGPGLDLLVGAKGYDVAGEEDSGENDGAVYVLVDQIAGATESRSLDEAWLKILWEGQDGALGGSLAALAATDGDGSEPRHAGLVLGAQTAEGSTGAVFIVTGDVVQDAPTTLDLGEVPQGRGPGFTVEQWVGPTVPDGPWQALAGLSVDAGDVNGDQVDDVVVGSFAGAWVLVGPFDDPGRHALQSEARLQIRARDDDETIGNQTGCSVAVVDGFDGTGQASVAVASCLADDGALDGGAVALIPFDSLMGAAPYVLGTSRETLISGEGEKDSLGVAVSDAGDLDGDGYHDVLVAAHRCGAGGGRCPKERPYGRTRWWVVPGGDGAPTGGPVSEVAAISVVLPENHSSCNGGDAGPLIGDTDHPDLAIGWCTEPDNAGAVAILRDPSSGSFELPQDADYVLEGGATGDLTGAEVHVAGSTLVVGAWRADGAESVVNAGAVYVLDVGSLDL